MSEIEFSNEDQKLSCCGCGGRPIDEGAVFIAVFYIKDGKRKVGGMCELCYLKKLQKRAALVNMSSGPAWQISIPELDIHAINRDRPKPTPRKYGAPK